jgi:hypothetical protein
MDDEEVAAKFRSLAEPVLGDERAARAFEAWNGIDAGIAVGEAMALLTR